MLQMKVYKKPCQTDQTIYDFKKKEIHLNIQKPSMPYLLARGDHRKTIKLIKVLRVKWAPVTGIDKGIVMDHYNRSLLVRHGDHH